MPLKLLPLHESHLARYAEITAHSFLESGCPNQWAMFPLGPTAELQTAFVGYQYTAFHETRGCVFLGVFDVPEDEETVYVRPIPNGHKLRCNGTGGASNSITLNGTVSNGAYVNGSPNGRVSNGTSHSGTTTSNEVTNGTTANGINGIGTSLNGTTPNGTSPKTTKPLPPSSLIAVARIRLEDAITFSTLQQSRSPPPGSNVDAYTAFFTMLGSAKLDTMGSNTYWNLDSLATATEAQGRGAGRMIVECMTRWADETVAEDGNVGVECFLEATEMGKPLYEKFGFEVVKVVSMGCKQFGQERDGKMSIMVRPRKGRKYTNV